MYGCLCVQFFVKLQYYKQHQSVQTSTHRDTEQPSVETDSDVLMQDDATHISSSNVHFFYKSEVCLVV